MKLVEAPGFVVRLVPTATSLFNISKLNLERNNVRALNQGSTYSQLINIFHLWEFQQCFTNTLVKFWNILEGGISQATPKYNSSILEDMLMEDAAESIKKVFLGWKELGEALILLKVKYQLFYIYMYNTFF